MPIVVNLRFSKLDILFQVLSESDKQCYAEKLKIKSPNDSVNLDDPYFINSNKWFEDLTLTLWPDLLYGDIYNYLIQSPGDYTGEFLKHYCSLGAYKYELSSKKFV